MCLTCVCGYYYRGYGESEKPPNVTDYRMSKLTKDVAELVSVGELVLYVLLVSLTHHNYLCTCTFSINVICTHTSTCTVECNYQSSNCCDFDSKHKNCPFFRCLLHFFSHSVLYNYMYFFYFLNTLCCVLLSVCCCE